MNADRNLLFGILAFQLNFIDRQALLAAFDRFTADKNKRLGDLLVELGSLNAENRQLLDGLVAAHLKQHGNDAEKSLAAVSSLGSVRADLERIADPDVRASLAGTTIHQTDDARPVDRSAPNRTSAGTNSSASSRFTILRPHAKGGLGQVWVARDEELNREVAFKEIQDRFADNPVSRSRFLLEAEVTGGLEHPGIVPVYGLGQYGDGRPFYAMRFIQGDSLQAAIKQFHGKGADERSQESEVRSQKKPAENKSAGQTESKSLEFRNLLSRFIDVCNAIEYAHSRRVLHRDLKPGNIMLGKYGETLVVDWGLAKPLGRRDSWIETDERTLQPASASDSGHTQMGFAVGTPQYMSPEQAAGRLDELGPATDIYSLGATLFCLLTGRAPFAVAEARVTVAQVAKGDFPPPRQIKPDVPAALQAICLKAMALEPEDRYASARALADDIEHWLADEPVTVYHEPFKRRFARWRRNHKTLVGATTTAFAVLLLGGLGASAVGRRANDQTRAQAATENVLTARADGVPYTLEYLRPIGRHTLARLRQHLANEQADPVQRLRAAYALADLDAAPRDFLFDAVATAPSGECRNLVAALAHVKEAALKEVARRSGAAAENAEMARYAIVALHLGDPQLAKDALAVREDPIHRTTLIHSYSGWHGELSTAARLLRANDDAAFGSGLCAAFGTIALETLEPAERDQATDVVLALYTEAPDGGTHAAAGWALRQWKRELPVIEPTSHPPFLRRWFVNGQAMTMVEVAAGKFTVGTAGAGGVLSDEPAHEVTLTKPFYLADRELTVEQFRRFIDDAGYPAAEKPKGWQEVFQNWGQFSPTLDCPVTTVNWFDAILYCNWLSNREGRHACYERTGEKQKILGFSNSEHECDIWRCDFGADGYRLPTEAEWEFASRAGSSGAFCYGNDEDLLSQYAWFLFNARMRTWPGGARLPSAVGLFDMHGNVFEWCWDCFGGYPAESVSDPTGVSGGATRVHRGGAFNTPATGCRSTNSHGYPPVVRDNFLGFRVCCGR